MQLNKAGVAAGVNLCRIIIAKLTCLCSSHDTLCTLVHSSICFTSFFERVMATLARACGVTKASKGLVFSDALRHVLVHDAGMCVQVAAGVVCL